LKIVHAEMISMFSKRMKVHA